MAANRKTFLMTGLFILTIGLWACSKMTKSEDDLPDYLSFDQLEDGYGVENAVEDDCVVFVDSRLISGEDVWKRFLAKAEKKQSCCVRIADFFDADSHFSLCDLSYEDSSFRVNTSTGVSREYNYLNHYEIDIKENDSEDSVMDLYILVDKEDATFDEIQKSYGRIGSYIVYLNKYHP